VGEKRPGGAAMTRLLMLVEGHSERKFVKDTLAPFLQEQGVYVTPIVVETKKGYPGGVVTWGKVFNNLKRLASDTNAWITTLIDFYGIPDDFPDYQNIFTINNPRERVIAAQTKFAEEIKTKTSHPRFIPFFALHEFEAWLFCSPEIVAKHFGNTNLVGKVREAVQSAGEPELINHGIQTHPKARLQGMVLGYKETSDGPILMSKIGIETIRAACPHFNGWLTRLEALGGGVP
jgi:hypothetical protein